MLTRQQAVVWRYIAARLRADGVAPTLVEIMARMGWRSKSAPVRILRALEDRGFISRRRYGQRGIELLRWPDEAPVCRYWQAMQPEGADMVLVEVPG